MFSSDFTDLRLILAVTLPQASKLYRARRSGRLVTVGNRRGKVMDFVPVGAYFHRAPHLVVAVCLREWKQEIDTGV